ncbi:MAG: DUF2298 domain-containing protein [Eubacteriales bacterium]|nr:DUF2298 domain-containing protein [Eubacteriales bacterium]
MKKWGPKAVLVLLLAGLSVFLLKGDVWTFWSWWLLAALMGMIAMPVTGRLFEGFDDKGWMFSKVLAVAVTGFLTWFLVAVKIMPFTSLSCILVCVVCAAGCFFLFNHQIKHGIDCFPASHKELVFWEEIIFFAVFLLWTYLAGFHPAAYGTEKFMDYGFMEAMMRSKTLPATDLWYSQGTINYYYGGQYFAVFLTKITGSKVEITYNLMRTFVAGLAFVLPFSLVYQMTKDRFFGRVSGKKAWIPAASGVVAGLAVCIAGNMHYVIYSKIIPWIQKFQGVTDTESYWFPDATRYIGYNPDVPDKTIHEFPCYSFVLGDLHAHVVNIMFVLLLVGLLYAWMKSIRTKEAVVEKVTAKTFWKRQLLMPHILLVSMLLGMFQWTNFWDFVIYFVVTGGVVLFTNIIRFRGKTRTVLSVTAAQAVEVTAIAYLVILPFTLKFETMIQGVALAANHSLPHQLLILWGLPIILTLIFIISVLMEKCRRIKNKSVYRLLRSIAIPDLFAVIMGLCAIGLVLIPELVYVRDIYEQGNARANTMFKLTYQAFILFGMAMGYVIFRVLVISRQKVFKVVAGAGLFCLLWTVGYFGNSVHSWFGDVWKVSSYQGLNATAFLENDFPEDASAVRWLKSNISGSPVVLEANGDSYTGYCRVSAMTGLPTVLGWYVHQWLWRNDVADLNQKSADIELVYTSQDEEQVRDLLDQYEVAYIFVGSKEREKYEGRINDELLKNLGEVVFADPDSPTYILKVGSR